MRPFILLIAMFLLLWPAAPAAAEDAFSKALKRYRATIDRPPLARRLGGMRVLARTRDVRVIKVFAERYARPRVPKDHERYLLARMCGEYLTGAVHIDPLFDFLKRHRDDADGWLWFQGLRGAARQPEIGRLLEWIEKDRANPFTRAAALEALVEAGRDEVLPLISRLFGEKLPRKGKARMLLAESSAAGLLAHRAVRSGPEFREAAGALVALLEGKEISDRSKLVVARRLARALGVRQVSLDPEWWTAILAREAVAETDGRQSVASPRFMGIEATGRRVVYLIDLSDSMLDPLTEEERGLVRRVPTGGSADFPWGEVKNRFDFTREHLRRSLRALAPDVRFAIIGFGNEAAPFRTTKSLTPATRQNVAMAIRELDSIEAKQATSGKNRPHGVLRGDTNLHGALLRAFQITTRGRVTENEHVAEATFTSGADTIFLLSDGKPTRDDFFALDMAEPGRVTTDAEKGGSREVGYRYTGNFFGPYRTADNLLGDLHRLNLFRKAEIHTISMGDADLFLMHRIAMLGLGRYRNLGGNGVLVLTGASALEIVLEKKPEVFTLECWAKGPKPHRTTALLTDTEESGGGLFWKDKEMTRPSAGVRGPEGRQEVEAGESWRWNRWTHLAMTYDGAALRFFVDGKLEGEAEGVSFVPSARSLFVGAEPTKRNRPRWFFRGSIDEVRLSGTVCYAEKFTPAKILRREASTLLLLHFDGDGETPWSDSSLGRLEVRPHGSPRIRSEKR